MPLATPILFDLTRRYCELHRHYHTISHVADMLWRGRELELSDVQIAAIWYHDAVYAIPSDGNERASAALAAAQLGPTWPAGAVAEVVRIVEDTEQHLPSIEASATVLDLDLASLADDWEGFCANTRRIRREYSCIDDAAFAAGQRRTYRRFLERERIFHTAWGARLEAAARANLVRALAEA